MHVPTEYGGPGLGALDGVIVAEELAYGAPVLSPHVGGLKVLNDWHPAVMRCRLHGHDDGHGGQRTGLGTRHHRGQRGAGACTSGMRSVLT